jgi:hypothetical protein
MTSLASALDVEAILGRSLTATEQARVEAILARLSAAFRREAQRPKLGVAGTSTMRLKVHDEHIYLPEPIVSIESVVDDDGTSVTDYEVQGNSLWLDGYPSSVFLHVEYEHTGAIPDEVRLVIADAARKVLLVPDEATTGVTKHDTSAGPFSESKTFAGWAVGGETMLGPDAKAVARAFRPQYPKVHATGAQGLPRADRFWLADN